MQDFFSALGNLFGFNFGGTGGGPQQPTRGDQAHAQFLSFLPNGGRYEPRPQKTPVYEMPHDIGEAVMAPFREISTIFEPPRLPKPTNLGLQRAAVKEHSPRVSRATPPSAEPAMEWPVARVTPMGEIAKTEPARPEFAAIAHLRPGDPPTVEQEIMTTDPTVLDRLLVGSIPADVGNKRIPAAIRTNNPGAMWGGASWQKKYGVLGKQNLNDGLGQGNNIAIFPTKEAGAAAQFDLLNRKYAGMSLQSAVRKWSGGNSSMAYALKLARATGAQLNTPMSEILRDRNRAMVFVKTAAAHEAGVKSYPMSDAQWIAGYDLYRRMNTKVASK